MGNRDEYFWEDEKSLLLKSKLGRGLDDICDLVFYNDSTQWEVFENPGYPDQYRVVAKVGRREYVTIPMEDISDEYGTFIKLATWWHSSNKEKRKFNDKRTKQR